MGSAQSAPTADAAPAGGAPGKRPSALVICGPSGVGKGTLIKRLVASSPDAYGFSCSHTTRAPREGEVDGVHYHFTDREAFEAAIEAGEFLEHAHVHGNIYGTSTAAVAAVADAGKTCILDIDVQGARAVRRAGVPAVFVFVAPPSLDELESRLRGRGTETEAQIKTRLKNAKDELESLNEPGLYDYVILNDDADAASAQLARVAARAAAGEVGNGTGGDGRPVAPSPWRGGAGATAAAGAAATSPLAGRVAVVTGASAGVGAATAKALAAAGARVVAVARRADRLAALKRDAVAAGAAADAILPAVLDVTREAECEALPGLIEKAWGRGAGIDILVNNAGVARAGAALFDGSTAAWVDMLETNVLAPAVLARVAVASMKARGAWGHVVNVGSMMGHRVLVMPDVGGMYAATKHALRALSEGLRLEARDAGVPLRVSLVSPGRIDTEFFEALHGGSAGGGGRKVAAGAAGPRTDGAPGAAPALSADDVADAILFALNAPPHVDVNDICVRPVGQAR